MSHWFDTYKSTDQYFRESLRSSANERVLNLQLLVYEVIRRGDDIPPACFRRPALDDAAKGEARNRRVDVLSRHVWHNEMRRSDIVSLLYTVPAITAQRMRFAQLLEMTLEGLSTRFVMLNVRCSLTRSSRSTSIYVGSVVKVITATASSLWSFSGHAFLLAHDLLYSIMFGTSSV